MKIKKTKLELKQDILIKNWKAKLKKEKLKKRKKKFPKITKSQKQREYKKYLKSKEWHQLRSLILDRDGYKCTKCGATDKELHVHHLTYKHFKNENPDELITLCRDCHKQAHHKKG